MKTSNKLFIRLNLLGKSIIMLMAYLLISINGISQNVFTVTKTTDPNPYTYQYNNDDNLCAPEMLGTLQWAFRKVNDAIGSSIINFNIAGSGPYEIDLNQYLPSIYKKVIIDGTTQPGYNYSNGPSVIINGGLLPFSGYGIVIEYGADSSIIKGLLIKNFDRMTGILVYADYAEITDNQLNYVGGFDMWHKLAVMIYGNNALVRGNRIGTDFTGTQALGCISGAVYIGGHILGKGNNCVIGGAGPYDYNILAYNLNATGIDDGCSAIEMWGGAKYNRVTRNKIYNNTHGIDICPICGNGGNMWKVAPTILKAEISNDTLYVNGTANPDNIIEIFGSTGWQNANQYYSTVNVPSGDVSWSAVIPDFIYPQVIATATDITNNTSNFSANLLVSIKGNTLWDQALFAATDITSTDTLFAIGKAMAGGSISGKIKATQGTATGASDMFQKNLTEAQNSLTFLNTLKPRSVTSAGPIPPNSIIPNGVYKIIGDQTINTAITLKGPSAQYHIFIINGNLTVESTAQVNLFTGVKASNVLWVVNNGNVIIKDNAKFNGNVITNGNISSYSNINGKVNLFSTTGDITLQNNNFSNQVYLYSQSAMLNNSCFSPADAGEDKTICLGQSAMLVATGGTQYQWSTYQYSNSIIVQPPQANIWWYYVTVTNANGCSAVDYTRVFVNPLPVADAGQDVTINAGQTANLNATGGIAYNWSDGQTGDVITVSPAITTTYTVTVTNANGCIGADDVTVTVNVSQPLISDAGYDKYIFPGQSVQIGSVPVSGMTYSWSPIDGLSDATIANPVTSTTVTTNYTLTVSFGNSIATDNVIVYVETPCNNVLSDTIIFQTGLDGNPLYQTGKIYLKIKDNSNVDLLNFPDITLDTNNLLLSALIQYGVTKVEKPFAEFDTPIFDRMYRITFLDTNNVSCFIGNLQTLNFVEYVEKVPALYEQIIPNDVQLVNQYYLPLINADAASNIYQTNPGAVGNTIVAVVDDAVLTTHVDLAANIITNNRDVADLDNDPNPPFTGDAAANGIRFSHGTHVAGIAGGVTDNEIGIASIGWSNNIMCVKTRKSDDDSDEIPFGYDGVTWASTHGAKVINMSWGGTVFSQAEYTVLAHARYQRGTVLVASAGNDATSNPNYPAAYGEGQTGQWWELLNRTMVIAVAAIDENNDISDWGTGMFGQALGSNYGAWVDIAAYGTNIVSTIASVFAPLNDQYAAYNGTSMAAPIVSGVAGLMRSYNPNATAVDIYNCLVYSANDDIYDNHPDNIWPLLGYGRVDAEAALKCLGVGCNNPIAVIYPSSNTICPGGNVTLTANDGIGYNWSTGEITQSINVAVAGIYSVTVTFTDGIEICEAVANINIQEADLNAHIVITENSGLVANDGILCGQGMVQLSSYWGLTYQWSGWGGAFQGPSIPGTINYGTDLPNTLHQCVTITGVGGCPGIQDDACVDIQWLVPPTVTITGNTTICQGQATTLTASASDGETPYSYLWSTGETTQDIIVNTPGTYSVTVTDAFGCTANNSITVSQLFESIPSFNIQTSAFCIAASVPVTFTSDLLPGNYGTLSYHWDFGDGTFSTLPNPSHTFSSHGYHCIALSITSPCGNEQTNMTIFVEPHSCACSFSYTPYVPSVISSNTTWYSTTFGTDNIYIKGTLTIEEGTKLTISNGLKLHFSPSGKIIVKRKATLEILDGVILTSLDDPCNYMWQGIEVWGYSDKPSSNINQGKVIIEKFSTIRNAHIGVLLGARIEKICNPLNSYFDLTKSGGVIVCGSTGPKYFVNNGIGIKFTAKNQTTSAMYSNTNKIINTYFQTQAPLLDPLYDSDNAGYYPNIHYPWNGNANPDGIYTIGIQLECMMNPVINTNTFTGVQTGIDSKNARLTYFGGSFTKVFHGIDIKNTNPALVFGNTIYNVTFNSYYGNTNVNGLLPAAVYITGGNNDNIYSNTFGDQFVQNLSTKIIGIYLYNCANFIIQNNSFNYNTTGIILSTLPVAGITNNGSVIGPNTNGSGNVFKFCKTGIVAGGKNTQLQIKCNIHGNITDPNLQNPNYYLNWNISGKLCDQGSFPLTTLPSTTRTKYAAGNEFTPGTSAINRKQIKYSPYLSTLYFKYYHHTPEVTDPDQRVKPAYLNAAGNPVPAWNLIDINELKTFNSCLPLSGSGGGGTIGLLNRVAFLQNSINALIQQANVILAGIDNHKTAELLAAVYGTTSTGNLKNLLVNNSPLSDTVISAAIVRNKLSNGNFKEVMERNLPVSDNVEPLFMTKLASLPAGIVNLLKPLQAYNSSYTTIAKINREIAVLETEKGQLLNMVYSLLIENDSLDFIISILENQNTTDATMKLAASYLATGDMTNAQAKFSELTADNSDMQDWIDLNSMIINLADSGKTIFDIDSLQIAYLRSLAYRIPGDLATVNAQAILAMVLGEGFPTYIPGAIQNQRFAALQNTLPEFLTVADNDNPWLGNNYPNPFNKNTIIPYKLPEGEFGIVNVFSYDGKKIFSYEVSFENNSLELKTDKWASGIYFYNLEINGIMLQHKKMALVK